MGSSLWRKLLKLRPEASRFMRCEVRSGDLTFFLVWQLVRHWKYYRHNMRFGIATWAYLVKLGLLKCVQMRYVECGVEVGEYLVMCIPLLRMRRNQILRREEMLFYGGTMRRTTRTISQQWELGIRLEIGGRSILAHIVWFTQGVPRHAFIVWLIFKDRLSIRVRMRQWGITQGCMLCGEPEESMDNLFFACPFTFTVWSTLTATLLGTTASPDWTITVTSLLRRNRNKMNAILLRMVFHTTIYFIWKERNSRRHLGPWVTT